jgi:uncharacterized protein with PIN domain
VLDVHLGTLARRLRLVGVDAAYVNDAGDDALVEQANAERRVLLTQDRGLLCRRKLWLGAYVRGATSRCPVPGRARPVQAAARAVDPMPCVQRTPVHRRQGSR